MRQVGSWMVLVLLAVAGCQGQESSSSAQDETTRHRDLDCAEGLSGCGGACISTASDAQNCGGCGHVCASGACRDGSCVEACAEGGTSCHGGCVDLRSDAENCGGCGQACPADQLCADGGCVPICEGSDAGCADGTDAGPGDP